jgi:DNA-binding response OmpR family regulator
VKAGENVIGNVATDRRHNHRPIVVMVDRNPETLDRVAVKLEREGFHVLTAVDATRGIDLVVVRRPSALLCSLNLCDGAAWAICAAARTQLSKQAPVIVITGETGLATDDEMRARALGVSILSAPSGVDDSGDTFERLLEYLRTPVGGAAPG